MPGKQECPQCDGIVEPFFPCREQQGHRPGSKGLDRVCQRCGLLLQFLQVAALEFIPSWVWFFLKLLALMCLFIWTRGTLPRLRQDQLMNFAWKFMIPMVLINLVAAALWHFISGGFTRWVVCGAIVVCSYLLLGRGLAQGKQITKRTYRFAD